LNIQMLGTGSAFAKCYYNTCASIEAAGRTVLIDCGHTTPKSIHAIGKSFADYDALIISHIHADHVGGMEEYAFKMKFIYNRKPQLFVPADLAEPLWENSLKGGLLQPGMTTLEDYFEVNLLSPGQPAELFPGFVVEPFLTKHIPGKLSYSFLINGTLFYSADMTFDAGLLHSLVERGCKMIFHDCQLRPPGVVHATLDELLTLPEWMQERIWLIHYDDAKPEYEGRTGKMQFAEQHHIYTIE
jgi:ribonuclease BN (tRNA processing enzyme)